MAMRESQAGMEDRWEMSGAGNVWLNVNARMGFNSGTSVKPSSGIIKCRVLGVNALEKLNCD